MSTMSSLNISIRKLMLRLMSWLSSLAHNLAYGGWARGTSGTIIAFFFEANKNKDNAMIALASSNN